MSYAAHGRVWIVIVGLLVVILGACSGGGQSNDAADSPSDDGPRIPPYCPEDDGTGTVTHPDLHAELLDMQEQDQAELSGELSTDASRERTGRLGEIIDEHGWPHSEMVGADGASAAWLIAQHADLDPDFQERALEEMWQHVGDCRVDPTEIAYLHDRVLVAGDEPQIYGTQMRCSDDGPVPATPLVDETRVEEYRDAVGMDPLSEYTAEMEAMCAQAPQ